MNKYKTTYSELLFGFISGGLGLLCVLVVFEAVLYLLPHVPQGVYEFRTYVTELCRLSLALIVFYYIRAPAAVLALSVGFAAVFQVERLWQFGFISVPEVIINIMIGVLGMTVLRQQLEQYRLIILPLYFVVAVVMSVWYVKLDYWFALIVNYF
jgi:hypothetical protein